MIRITRRSSAKVMSRLRKFSVSTAALLAYSSRMRDNPRTTRPTSSPKSLVTSSTVATPAATAVSSMAPSMAPRVAPISSATRQAVSMSVSSGLRPNASRMALSLSATRFRYPFSRSSSPSCSASPAFSVSVVCMASNRSISSAVSNPRAVVSMSILFSSDILVFGSFTSVVFNVVK